MNKKIFFLFLVLFSSVFLYAHPHTWMTSTQEFVFKNNKLQGFYITWSFDAFFSSDIIYGYDFDADGKFNKEENQAVYENAFINLKNYYYFTFIRQGEVRTNPPQVSQFTAWYKDTTLYYKFYIDLSSYTEKEFFISVYDYTYFCDIAYPDEDPITITTDSTAKNITYEIIENKDYPVFYNPLGAADDTRVYNKWKPGLQTYYPREIHIKYE